MHFDLKFQVMLKTIFCLALVASGNGRQGDLDNHGGVERYYSGELNAQCVKECNKTCVSKCPEPYKCRSNEVKCGKKDHPGNVWPDCSKDDICVPQGCECK